MNVKLLINFLNFFVILTPLALNAQSSFRTIDGSDNNLNNVQLGAIHAPLRQATTVGFADGLDLPGLINNPNPRTISNEIFAQSGLVNDPLQLSDFTWVFGQFLDHDITLVGENHAEPLFINIPSGDQWFDPFFQGTAIIPMFRSLAIGNSGNSPNNPRVYGNEITHWIDASNVYGSDLQRSFWLRTFSDGKLKTSAGNLLPYNTASGEFSDQIDTSAPHMDNATGLETTLFVAGDSRANENLLLIAMHTLFVREHNRICDEILEVSPGLADELVYQDARKKVGAFLQSIVYNEWLPAMGVYLGPYNGYNENVDPSITNVFSAAAFRLGHTLLNANILRIGNDGNEIPEGNVTLQEAFFKPSLIQEGGISPLFKGMGIQVQQNLDGKIVDDVRNFLFGPPGAGGLDLAAININRGRERGLSDFNTIRTDFSMGRYSNFDDIHSDPSVGEALEGLYDSVDDIDPWVGMLLEEHEAGSLLGPTIIEILTQQFQDLRDGDRFYFEDDPLLTNEDIAEIKNTTLADLIKRNTDIILMQDNVFEAMPHGQLCPASGPFADLQVQVTTESGDDLKGARVTVSNNGVDIKTVSTRSNGISTFENLGTCSNYELVAEKETNPVNGVTSLDLALIQRHILNVVNLDSPYKMIAADVNNSGTITTVDLVEMQQLILGILPEYQNSSSWKFMESDFSFENPVSPLSENYENLNTVDFLTASTTVNYIGIKIGDVNGSANFQARTSGNALRSNDDLMVLSSISQKIAQGAFVEVPITISNLNEVIGYQFSLNYNNALTLNEIIPGDVEGLSTNNFAHFEENGVITSAWFGEVPNEKETVLFTLKFTANEAGDLSKLIHISSDITMSEAYNNKLEPLDVQLVFEAENAFSNTAEHIELFQNTPNPFTNKTTIGFSLPVDGSASLTVYDVNGKVTKAHHDSYTKGYHEIALDRKTVGATGLLYYTLSSDFGTITRKMILID